MEDSIKYVTYHPYFEEWDGWMDGYVTITDEVGHTLESIDMDFMSLRMFSDDKGNAVIIQPFTAKSARIYLAVRFSVPVERVSIKDNDDVFNS